MNRVRDVLDRWFKTPENLGNGFFILALIAVGIGNYLDVPMLTNLGLGFFGAGIVTWGANAMVRGEMTPIQRGFHVMEHVEGILTRAWGLVLIFGGLALLGYSILSVLNPRSPMPDTVRRFISSPQGSPILLILGSMVGVLFALSMIFVSDDDGGNSLVQFLKSIPGRLVGIVLLVIFGAIAAANLLLLVAPTAWQELSQAILQYLLQALSNL